MIAIPWYVLTALAVYYAAIITWIMRDPGNREEQQND